MADTTEDPGQDPPSANDSDGGANPDVEPTLSPEPSAVSPAESLPRLPDDAYFEGTVPPDDGGTEDLAAVVAARTGPDAPEDGRFHHTFVLPPTSRIAEDSWADAAGADELHAANYVAVLQKALLQGLHAQGPVAFDDETVRRDGSVELAYSVEVIPTPPDASNTYSPARALDDMGGTTHDGPTGPDGDTASEDSEG